MNSKKVTKNVTFSIRLQLYYYKPRAANEKQEQFIQGKEMKNDSKFTQINSLTCDHINNFSHNQLHFHGMRYYYFVGR